MDQPDDILQAVAVAMAGEDGCCCLWDIDGRCCMTENAKRVIKVINEYLDLDLHAQRSRSEPCSGGVNPKSRLSPTAMKGAQ